MKGMIGTISPYRNRYVKRPMPTVQRMKSVLERCARMRGGFLCEGILWVDFGGSVRRIRRGDGVCEMCLLV